MENEADTITLNLKIPLELSLRIKRICVNKGVKMKEFVPKIIEKQIKIYEKKLAFKMLLEVNTESSKKQSDNG